MVDTAVPSLGDRVFVTVDSSHLSTSSGSCAFWALTYTSDVVVDRDSGPVLGDDPSSPRVDLAEEGVVESGTVESDVESSDSGEKRRCSHVTGPPQGL
jgi:hypothetical protein